MHIGITGTRDGMTEKQANELRAFFAGCGADTVFHHGDCVGVDVQAAAIAKDEFKFWTVCHPPIKTVLRGYHNSDEFREEKDYLARNRDIVNESILLLVVPSKDHRYSRSGTWYTHDYAAKKGKPRRMLWPTKLLVD